MNDYYTFTGKTKQVRDHTLHQIRATRDLPQHKVKAGQIGGWIEGEHNLKRESWLGPDCKIYGPSMVTNSSLLTGYVDVSGESEVADSTINNATVYKSKVYNSELSVGVNINSSSVVESRIKGRVFIRNESVVMFSFIKVDVLKLDNIRLGYADITHQLHFMAGETFTSRPLKFKLYRRADGYHLNIGCQKGAVPYFRKVFKKKTWFITSGLKAKQARKEMLAFCDMLEARIQRWDKIG